MLANRVLLSFFLLWLVILPTMGPAQDERYDTVPRSYSFLTQTDDWLNVARPLTPDDLKGRILLVDFWTYCCINCLHVIPKLQALEAEFGNQLTVVGVHSAKFATEGDTDNIREA